MNQSKTTKPLSVVWQDGHVSLEDRVALLGQRPVTVWLTGLSGAGKSSLAFALEHYLTSKG
ncbi:MAG: adenylyl-sulfate kinase, partial [Gallionellaceae bacterium]